MQLKELLSVITNIPITIMLNDGDNHCTVLHRGDSKFYHMTENEGNTWVQHISPHRGRFGELFVMVEE